MQLLHDRLPTSKSHAATMLLCLLMLMLFGCSHEHTTRMEPPRPWAPSTGGIPGCTGSKHGISNPICVCLSWHPAVPHPCSRHILASVRSTPSTHPPLQYCGRLWQPPSTRHPTQQSTLTCCSSASFPDTERSHRVIQLCPTLVVLVHVAPQLLCACVGCQAQPPLCAGSAAGHDSAAQPRRS